MKTVFWVWAIASTLIWWYFDWRDDKFLESVLLGFGMLFFIGGILGYRGQDYPGRDDFGDSGGG